MSKIAEVMRSESNFYAEYGVSALQIEQAEKLLGLNFALDFKECLCEFGAITVNGHEFTGFSGNENLDVIKVTQNNRKKHNVEKNLYVIEETHIDGIVIWQDENGVIYETTPGYKPRKIADSLLEFISK